MNAHAFRHFYDYHFTENRKLWDRYVTQHEYPLENNHLAKDELQAYLDYGRRKCQATIEALTDETAQRRCRFAWGEVSFVELQLYNMRHVQEHAAQLSLLLGQKGVSAPDSVTTARNRAA